MYHIYTVRALVVVPGASSLITVILRGPGLPCNQQVYYHSARLSCGGWALLSSEWFGGQGWHEAKMYHIYTVRALVVVSGAASLITVVLRGPGLP